MDRPGALDRALREALRGAADLVVPLACACGTEGAVLCDACAALIAVPPVRVEAACGALQVLADADARAGRADFTALMPVLALGAHAGALRRQVLAFKNGGQFALARPLGRALAPGLSALLAVPGALEAPVALVPVPSSLTHRWRRGEDHTALLAREIARVRACGGPAPREGPPVPRIPVVSAVGMATSTQAGKAARERARGRAHRLRALRPMRELARIGRAVIIDDVLTTGSTLRAVHDVLTENGCDVLGALVIAAARVPAGPGAVPAGGVVPGPARTWDEHETRATGAWQD